jgi:hypothetical protein
LLPNYQSPYHQGTQQQKTVMFSTVPWCTHTLRILFSRRLIHCFLRLESCKKCNVWCWSTTCCCCLLVACAMQHDQTSLLHRGAPWSRRGAPWSRRGADRRVTHSASVFFSLWAVCSIAYTQQAHCSFFIHTPIKLAHHPQKPVFLDALHFTTTLRASFCALASLNQACNKKKRPSNPLAARREQEEEKSSSTLAMQPSSMSRPQASGAKERLLDV